MIKSWIFNVLLNFEPGHSLILKWRYHGWIDLPTVRQFSVRVRDPSWTAFAHHWLSRPSAMQYIQHMLTCILCEGSPQGSFQGARRLSDGYRCEVRAWPYLVELRAPTTDFQLQAWWPVNYRTRHWLGFWGKFSALCVWQYSVFRFPPGAFLRCMQTVHACSLALCANSLFTWMICH